MGVAPSIFAVIPARLHRCARMGVAPSILAVIPARLHRVEGEPSASIG